MCDVADVAEDRNAARLLEEYQAGKLTAAQLVQLTLAVGRLQGLYMSARQLAADTALVMEHNRGRRFKSEAECVRVDAGGRVSRGLFWRAFLWARS